MREKWKGKLGEAGGVGRGRKERGGMNQAPQTKMSGVAYAHHRYRTSEFGLMK